MKPGRLGLAELATLILALSVLPLAMSATHDQPPHIQTSSAYVPAERCPVAQRAIGFYRQKYTASRNRIGLEGAVPRKWYPCDAARRRATEWRQRAQWAHSMMLRWQEDQWAWQRWLPDKWQRIGACETGYGQRPGNWRHNSGAYQGAFGFANQSWDSFVPHADPRWGPYPSEAYLATPRQQYEVALAIYRRYGLSGWGCRGA